VIFSTLDKYFLIVYTIGSMNKIIEEINPERWYRPREIAQNNWICNSKGKGDYYLVLKLIRKNRLRARDFGLGKTPYYLVCGSEIIRYIESFYPTN